MDARIVLMVGFCAKGYFTLEPLICKVYGILKCDRVETVEDLPRHEGFIDSIFISLFYLGLDFEKKIKKIRNLLPGIQIVCYASHFVNVQIGAHLIRSGIDVLYANVDSPEEYAKAVDGIRNHHRYYPKNVRDAFASDEVGEPAGFLHLSPKEREWLDLTIKGNSVKDIQAAMNVSHGTVSSMRKNTIRKMGVKTTHQLLYRAFLYNFGRGGEFEDAL